VDQQRADNRSQRDTRRGALAALAALALPALGEDVNARQRTMEDGELEPKAWEYAIMIWAGDDPDSYRSVRFSHRENLTSIGADEYLPTLRELGDEGFELVTHQFLVSGLYDRGGRYSDVWRELLTFKRPLDEE
jgi:hypothetical protein